MPQARLVMVQEMCFVLTMPCEIKVNLRQHQ